MPKSDCRCVCLLFSGPPDRGLNRTIVCCCVCARNIQCQRLKAGLEDCRWEVGAILRLVAKELWFCVRGSADDDRCSGMEKRMSLRIMRSDMPLLNSSTCLRMYFKKASDDHLPMSIIM